MSSTIPDYIVINNIILKINKYIPRRGVLYISAVSTVHIVFIAVIYTTTLS